MGGALGCAIVVEDFKIVFVWYYHVNSIVGSITCSVHRVFQLFEINSTCNAQNNTSPHAL